MRTYKVTFTNADKSYEFVIKANGTDAAVESATKKIKARLKDKYTTNFRHRCEQIDYNGNGVE